MILVKSDKSVKRRVAFEVITTDGVRYRIDCYFDAAGLCVETVFPHRADGSELRLERGEVAALSELVAELQAVEPLAESAKPCDHGSLLNMLLRPIDDLKLSVRAMNVLQRIDVQYIGELVRQSERYLRKLRDFGPVTLEEVKAALAHVGLSLEFKLDDVLATFEHHLEQRKKDKNRAPALYHSTN